MDLKTIAINLFPCWVLGIFMLWTTFKSEHRDLLRIDKRAVAKWLLFLVFITIYRYFSLHIYARNPYYRRALQSVTQIPWQATLMVFWEDAAHTLPLLLLRRLIGTKWYTWPIHILSMAIIMLSFGSGHLYQGLISAIMLMFYIPITLRIANKSGLGTVILCHTLYDLVTIVTLQWMVRGL